MPIGALATCALAAWLLGVAYNGGLNIGGRAGNADTQAVLLGQHDGDLDVVFGSTDLKMLGDDLDFYVWLEKQPGFGQASRKQGGEG